METTTKKTNPARTKGEETAQRGLWLPAKLQRVGIRVEAGISIEYQELARRYVLRGKESGGATNELGAYCSFAANDGQMLGWTQKIDTIAVNGVHAIVIASALVRVEVLRVEHTYDLLITRHSMDTSEGPGRRPKLGSEVMFHGRLGQLALDLWSRDKKLRGSVSPIFLSHSGEAITLPEGFEDSVNRVVAGACCVGCRRHTHLLVAPHQHPADTQADGEKPAMRVA